MHSAHAVQLKLESNGILENALEEYPVGSPTSATDICINRPLPHTQKLVGEIDKSNGQMQNSTGNYVVINSYSLMRY